MAQDVECNEMMKVLFVCLSYLIGVEKNLRKQHNMEPEDILRKQIWLSYFWNVFCKGTETKAKQTVQFNSCQIICLEQFLLKLFDFSIFFFTLLNTFSHISYHILAFAIFIYYNLFLEYLYYFRIFILF